MKEIELQVCVPCWESRDKQLILHKCKMTVPKPIMTCHCPCAKEVKIRIA